MKFDVTTLMKFWPPFLGAGIRVKNVSDDYRSLDVELKFKWWNKNYVGVQFGGSLYSMTDPFYMLMLMKNLGEDYIVWDKSSSIRFLKPGRSKVTAHFEISQQQLDEIKNRADTEKKVEPEFTVEIKSPDGTLIAEVKKLLYVRHKGSIKQ